ncbi:hypothetical protein F5Y17DRAFT_461984 [Xylariaceae sp. FL0594]|nr:hypothetical protein F5Y17DRAFT_461984 [Xylariaceae sp. FL0594]
MFLHSGASLHGHEFSNKPCQADNPFLGSDRPSLVNRAITFPAGSPILPDLDNVFDVRTWAFFPASRARSLESLSVKAESDNELIASQVEATSEDGTSFHTGIEEMSVPATTGTSRIDSRKRTTYIIAHPPPKLRTKQRILHIRPNLVLQVQQVLPGVRPCPMIDVYPSSAIASSIIAPLLKRFPRIAPIKNELSIHDLLLVKSEDYASTASGPKSGNEEDNLMARDLLAILSPSIKEDRTEIVMADGTSWVASTRTNKRTYSYEFTSTDPTGKVSTARWVRRQVVSSSLPGTPTSPGPELPKPRFSDCKFTFSFIDPSSRRHPIVASLTSSSLNISDTYRTVRPSADQCPPSPSSCDQQGVKASTQSLEEWQKAFISVSAVWVALRQGWAPNFRPENLMPPRVQCIPHPTQRGLHGRKRSRTVTGTSSQSTSTSPSADNNGRPKFSIALRRNESHPASSDLPRRAISTGAAFMQKRMAAQPADDNDANDTDDNRIAKLNKRAFSGEWDVGLLKGARDKTLAEAIMDSARSSLEDTVPEDGSLASSPPPDFARRRVVSAYAMIPPLSTDLDNTDVATLGKDLVGVTGTTISEKDELAGSSPKGRRRKLKSMANWFRKLSGR